MAAPPPHPTKLLSPLVILGLRYARALLHEGKSEKAMVVLDELVAKMDEQWPVN